MKVMFEPAVGTNFMCCGKNHVAKKASSELPVRREGLSNEEIYNAIMSVKNKLTKVFTREPEGGSLNMVG